MAELWLVMCMKQAFREPGTYMSTGQHAYSMSILGAKLYCTQLVYNKCNISWKLLGDIYHVRYPWSKSDASCRCL